MWPLLCFSQSWNKVPDLQEFASLTPGSTNIIKAENMENSILRHFTGLQFPSTLRRLTRASVQGAEEAILGL